MTTVAELASMIRTELVRRAPDLSGPRNADFLESTALLAASTAALSRSVAGQGCAPATADLLTKMTGTLLRNLHMIGSDRLGGSATEGILTDAIRLDAAVFELRSPAGNA